jgi:ParD-like antitoxin of type II bacterial toxin-antitoxin system
MDCQGKKSMSVSISVDQQFYTEALIEAEKQGRSPAEQIQFWAKLGRTAILNPDLPAAFIADCLLALDDKIDKSNYSLE